MITPAQAARTNSAIQILQCMHEGMTVVDACQKAGLPRSTFYDIIKKNPEALAKVQELVDACGGYLSYPSGLMSVNGDSRGYLVPPVPFFSNLSHNQDGVGYL